MKEHETVVLLQDQPQHGLEAGDIGAIVHCYHSGEEFEVEFVTFSGRTAALVTLGFSEVRPVASNEIAHARAVGI